MSYTTTTTARQLAEALSAATERLRHLHGLRMSGEPRPLDFERELKAAYAALSEWERNGRH